MLSSMRLSIWNVFTNAIISPADSLRAPHRWWDAADMGGRVDMGDMGHGGYDEYMGGKGGMQRGNLGGMFKES